MKIKKGNITRNIDEKRLEVYKAKGYAVVEATHPPPEPQRKQREPKE